MAEALGYDVVKLDRLGQMLYERFDQYEKDRQAKEAQWMKNLRQFRGIYDPEVEQKIPAGQSKAYPKITRQKVIGTVARLMEMLFPQTEKNWGIAPSPQPDLSVEDTQAVLDTLQGENPGAELTDEQIEKLIMETATKKAQRMGVVIEDQLSEIEYITLARKVLFSGVLYGAGHLEGPFVKREKTRKWSKNPYTGRYEAKEVERLKPYFEHLRVWDWYPDFSAKTLDQQDGYFKRPVMSRAQVAALADRPDFMGDRVREWLRKNDSGNYRERDWEVEVRGKKSDRQNIENLSGRKYEARVWTGYVSGHDLRAAGVNIPENELHQEHEANVWLLDRMVVKCRLNPMQTKRRPIHTFIYEEDDINLAGIGLPEVVRDSQMGICESVRMMFDNGSVVCGPILLARMGRLAMNQDLTPHAYKTYFSDPDSDDVTGPPPIENLNINSHIDELRAIVAMCMEFMDAETALPPPALGDVTQGGSEALRTRGNASMFLGAAALPIRDTVRNFDSFTTSFISSLYDWNMEFNTDASIKGDYVIIARGSTSLIAKEVRSQGLDYLAQTLQPEERIFLKGKQFLLERMRVRDLDFDELLEDDEVVQQKQAQQAQMAQEQAAQQRELIAAQVQDLLAKAMNSVAKAETAGVKSEKEVFEAITGAMRDAADLDNKAKGARASGGGSSN